ncbi:hypothetical protein E2C01_101652 [Portunus trituberculatus]|uniref:Uncharacterized protein n=1 Tax=Portunus trituberculatus TaxID=210409 RepID=A0A5B7KA55_PORTR|nr:hypothetical protein [Portunus trituberculatus]
MVGRREVQLDSDKAEQKVVDFDNLDLYKEAFQGAQVCQGNVSWFTCVYGFFLFFSFVIIIISNSSSSSSSSGILLLSLLLFYLYFHIFSHILFSLSLIVSFLNLLLYSLSFVILL